MNKSERPEKQSILKWLEDQNISKKLSIGFFTIAALGIMEGNTIKGVIYESKEGRKAILAKIVIDATGDGDLYSQTEAPFESMV